jgi:hypothetical protein
MNISEESGRVTKVGGRGGGEWEGGDAGAGRGTVRARFDFLLVELPILTNF